MIRRHALQLAAGLLAAASFAAQAAEFPIPGKPITLVLPSTPGSAGDQVLRMLADKLKDDWKAAPIIVESKAGAGGFIGSQFVARAAPDGHTMLLGFSVLVQAAAFGQNPPFDTEKDFIPVARLNDVPLALYTGDLSINSLADFVAKAKAKPAEFNFGTYGAATTGHAYSALINMKNGMELTHVPFRGTQPLVNALLGGHVKSGVSNLDGMAHVKAGKLKVLAVTGTKRSVLLPDVPTFAEQGYTDITSGGRYWLMLPAGVPPDVVEKIRESVYRVLKMPDVREKMIAIGLEPTPGEREDVAADMKREMDYWKRTVQATGIKAGN
jgi:tripartite-type tricarboxylate transporter receptor subunit TctC